MKCVNPHSRSKMNKLSSQSPAALRLRFVMDGEGNLRWRNGKCAGLIAGKMKGGYRQVLLAGRFLMAHRIVWAMVNDEWPPSEIDHIDCNKTNNRPENLRLATRSQNCFNKSIYKNNKSGFKGVCYDKSKGRFRASIAANKKNIILGLFSTPELAHAAYLEAALRLHGEFARAA